MCSDYFDNNNNNWWDQMPNEYSYPESPSLFNTTNCSPNNISENCNFYKNGNYQPAYDGGGSGSLCENVNVNFQNSIAPGLQIGQKFYRPELQMIENSGPLQRFLPNRPFMTPPIAGVNRFGSPHLNQSNGFYANGSDCDTYAPCQGPKPWNYAYCYGYYGEQPCQFVDVIDIEDFMSNEKRKEKSRDAARCRRSRETEIFTELGQVLPLQQEEVEQLDKASIMRLAIAFLKIREMLKLFPNIETPELLPNEDDKLEEIERKPFDLFNGSESYKYLSNALDGFLMILSGDGDIIYVSDTISEYLGISQIDLLGQQIWEYTHQCDHDELKEALNMRRNSLATTNGSGDKNDNTASNTTASDGVLTTAHRDIFLRLKCTLTSRGRSVNIKSASYKVIHVTGHMVMNSDGERILIAVGRPIPHPSNIEIPLGSATFLTKHSLDMKFTYVDDKMLSFLGYKPEDLLGKSLYDCHHGADSESLMTTFKSVLSKGQGETCRYRFLGESGGYCWVVTQATIVYDKQKPQSVVCVNYAVSELENNNEIYSCAQLEAANLKCKEITPTVDKQHQQENHQHSSSSSKYYSSIDKHQNIKLQDAIPLKPANNNNNNNNNNLTDKILLKTYRIKNNVVENPNDLIISKSDTVAYSNAAIQQSNLDNCKPPNDDIAPLSPVRRSFNSLPIIIKTNSQPEKRPKSVTASVFTQVPIQSEHIVTLNQQPVNSLVLNQQQQQQQLPPIKAQSVTASVLTPISSLTTPINRAFLPSGLCKNLAARYSATTPTNTNNTNNTSANSSSGDTNNNNNNSSNNLSEDMNNRYLMFSEESPDLTMLKEEPDDLTHLAPSLDDSPQLFGEMLESLMLPDAYDTLLSDEINSLDSQNNSCNTNNKNNAHIDPFINYRDESSDTSSSPHLLSPGSMTKSPEMSSIPSLCSPNSLSQDDEFAFMTMNVEDDIDLTMRAPYIPMNEQEDLPLLTDDLMWSAFSEELSLHKDALQIEALKNNQNATTNSSSTTATTTTTSNNGSNNNDSINSSNSTTTISNNTNSSNSSLNNSTNNSSLQNSLSENESSLAALLCGGGGNSIQQQNHQLHHKQQHQQHHQRQDNSSTLRNDSISSSAGDSKRRKILLGNVVDPTDNLIDDFSPVFNKNSSDVNCWTMNDLLQIDTRSTNNSPATTVLQNQNHPEKQNIIINTATAIHVPLITIQNKNSKLNCNNILNGNTTTGNTNTTTTVTNSTNTGNNPNMLRRLSPTLTKTANVNSCNGKTTINSLNIGAIITTVSNNANNSCSKRPSNIILTSDMKRLKNSPIIESPTSPQLLQQLMASTPHQQRGGMKTMTNGYEKMPSHSRWNNDNENNSNNCNSGQQHQQQSTITGLSATQSPSNSVLKNLLVSGCDDMFPQESPDNLLDETTTIARSLQTSPNPDSFFIRPLVCKTPTEQILRRCGANPLIGGVGIVPSPPMSMDSEGDGGGGGGGPATPGGLGTRTICLEPLVAGTFSPGGSESGDSGVECCGSLPSSSRSLEMMCRSRGTAVFDADIKMDTTPPRPLLPSPSYPLSSAATKVSINSAGNGIRNPTVASSTGVQSGRAARTMSFSFLDDENPLCSPFLMDLGGDDYSMDGGDFLLENEITTVFNDWTAK